MIDATAYVTDRKTSFLGALIGLLIGLGLGAAGAVAVHNGNVKICSGNPCSGTSGEDDIFGNGNSNNIFAHEKDDYGEEMLMRTS